MKFFGATENRFEEANRDNAWAAVLVAAVVGAMQVASAIEFWQLATAGQVVVLILLTAMLKGKLRGGAVIAHCTVGALLLLGPTFKVGIVISCVLMLALGELLVDIRTAATARPDHLDRPTRPLDPVAPLVAAGVAGAAALVVLVAVLLPEARVLSVAIIIAGLFVAGTLFRLMPKS